MKERFKFNTVGLFTRDNKATVDFYTKTFGFTTDWDGIQPNVEMMLGDMRIILFPRDAFEKMVSRKFQYPEGFNCAHEWCRLRSPSHLRALGTAHLLCGRPRRKSDRDRVVYKIILLFFISKLGPSVTTIGS